MSDTTRRDFLAGSAGLLAGGQTGGPSGKKDRMIGLQIGAVSFVDEGVEPVLDILQAKGSVNALFIAAFTYGRGIAGRQVPGQPLPDHGQQKYDSDPFHGGSYAAIHEKYYANTPLKNLR